MMRTPNYHSYALSDDGKHFLWGKNQNKQCLIFEDDIDQITLPFNINPYHDMCLNQSDKLYTGIVVILSLLALSDNQTMIIIFIVLQIHHFASTSSKQDHIAIDKWCFDRKT
eukprot:678_1